MTTENQPPYLASEPAGNKLASRWSRLAAAIIDGLILTALMLPVMYLTGGYDLAAQGVKPSFGYSLMLMICGAIIFVFINGKLLINNGQTIGKRLLDIKIVDLDGNLPSVNNHLLKRYAVYFIPGQVPVVGPLFNVINVLFIFNAEKRCIHDLVAKTKVVECR